ncbi:hypothetical protein BN1044_01153 [Hafnia alvei]|uniref:Uncharacterized protein n=1 Tax=Hafnia alvei TaxID=569 RepID=A0A1C6YY90_HAFAL|nr:hypothetical protein BN1044_01153 [Hafnia alvei]
MLGRPMKSALIRQVSLYGHVIQGQVSTDNPVGIGIHGKVQFSPDAALFLTVLFTLHSPSPKTFNPVESTTR